MESFPDFSTFKETYKERPQVVWTSLVSDLETPVSAMLKLSHGKSNCFLLESVEGGNIRGRYSFIGLSPDLIWRCFGDRAEINRKAITDAEAFETCREGAIDSLRSIVAASAIQLPEGMPPMSAGLIGYMSYDTVRLAERLPDNNPDLLATPDGIFMRPTVIAVFDGIEDKISVVTPVWMDNEISAEKAYQLAVQRIGEVVMDFDHTLSRETVDKKAKTPEAVSNMSAQAFHDMIDEAKKYILAGDIFQVVLSQRFQVPFTLPALSLYRALRRINPSPFLFYLNFADFSVVGSSPEILVRVRGGKVTIRPIAGTRPRGKTPEEDRKLEKELLADPKELAEHLMLLDLGRNDVGRVSLVGTVQVTEKMAVEYYSHVMHIVSNVEGDLNPKLDAIDALLAGFPAGTVSGAPKIRAMEIIDELEQQRRGVYGGCIGYFGANGDMDTCIALRTAVVKDGVMYVQAGGGIVADSDPKAECQESRNKAKALIMAAEEAVKFAAIAYDDDPRPINTIR